MTAGVAFKHDGKKERRGGRNSSENGKGGAKEKKIQRGVLYYSVETTWITVSYDTGAIGTSNGEEENAS